MPLALACLGERGGAALALSCGRCGAFGLSVVLVAENARDAQLREGSIGYPGAVGQQMRRSRSISSHRDPDSAPIRVVSVQRSVFLSITRSFTKRVALEGSRPSGEISFGVLLRASKRGQQTRQANEGRRANRGRRCVHDSALRSRRVSVNTPPSPVRRLRQPTAGNLQLCEADHA